MSTGLSTTQLTLKEASDIYEDGKHRRYSLLFAVNGGAFAVAKLLTGEPGKSGVVLGGLTLQQLAFGMILFTAIILVMCWRNPELGRPIRGYTWPQRLADWLSDAGLLTRP